MFQKFVTSVPLKIEILIPVKLLSLTVSIVKPKGLQALR